MIEYSYWPEFQKRSAHRLQKLGKDVFQMKRLIACTLLVLFVVAISVRGADGQNSPSQKSASPAPPPDISGLWLRMDPTGSGDFLALNASRPKPELVNPPPDNFASRGVGNLRLNQQGAPHAAGDPYVVTHGECDSTGGTRLDMMEHPAALDIVQTKDEVVVASEVSNVRYFYLDGRPLPTFGSYDYIPVGYSVGHWDGDTLAVETVGVRAPALGPGGASSSDTHLMERYHLKADGKRMEVTFTWIDPRIYAKPWTYTYTYQKLPAAAYAFEEWCDSSDPLQGQSIVPPKQN